VAVGLKFQRWIEDKGIEVRSLYNSLKLQLMTILAPTAGLQARYFRECKGAELIDNKHTYR